MVVHQTSMMKLLIFSAWYLVFTDRMSGSFFMVRWVQVSNAYAETYVGYGVMLLICFVITIDTCSG